jgi:hypothetical protein
MADPKQEAEAEAKAAAKEKARQDADPDFEPSPDDLIEVKITGPCTLGPGGLEPIGKVVQLLRWRAPKSATTVIRRISRG